MTPLLAMGDTTEQPFAEDEEVMTVEGLSPMEVRAFDIVEYMAGHNSEVVFARLTPVLPATGTLTHME